MVERVLYCDKCKDDTTFSYTICPECGGIYYTCNKCKTETKKVPKADNETYKKSCECQFI